MTHLRRLQTWESCPTDNGRQRGPIITTINQTSLVTYASGRSLYTPASFEESRRGLTEKTPNQFTSSSAPAKSVQYFSTNTRSDGGPFDPARTSNMSITIAAPNILVDPRAIYYVTLQLNSGQKDALSVAFAPSFDANSGICLWLRELTNGDAGCV